MKNIITLIFSLLVSGFLLAQTLPNQSFEQWEDHTNYMEPQNWNSSNQVTFGFGVVGVTRSEDAYAGNYSASMETLDVLGIAMVPGIITLADFYLNLGNATYGVSGGIFMQERVTELDGMYKYAGVDNDSAAILMYNYRNVSGEMDTIGYGFLYLHNTSEWAPFKVHMQYQNDHTPDTLNIAIFSSGNVQYLHIGSVLLVDSLVLHTYTGIYNLSTEQIRLNVYPNPASKRISFETSKTLKNRVLNIYNSLGNLLVTLPFEKKKLSLNLDGFISGTYFYKVLQNNRLLGTGKFLKE